MDEHIVHLISVHLAHKDIAMFAMVNKMIYRYCKHTTIYHERCANTHCVHRFILTLLQHAKLQHCVQIVQVMKSLSLQKLPMKECMVHISLKTHYDTTIEIMIGRMIVINNVVYICCSNDFFYDACTSTSKSNRPYRVLHILDPVNLDRFTHKMNSIITHTYKSIDITFIDHIKRYVHKPLANTFKHSVTTYFVKAIRIV